MKTDARLRFALNVSTIFGTGRLPIIPGTYGSAVGIAVGCLLAWFTRHSSVFGVPSHRGFLVGYLLVNGVIAAAGVWASSLACSHLGHKDPPVVVIDEVSGQLITMAGSLGGLAGLNWKSLLLGFILFRGFDVLKPFPARRAEWLPGGWGVMADDWVAGGYAAIVLWFLSGFLH